MSAVPIGLGMDFRKTCRFLGVMLRAPTGPPGVGGFMPCGIGANHCRLRHIGHGLTSWPRETAEPFLNELLKLLAMLVLAF